MTDKLREELKACPFCGNRKQENMQIDRSVDHYWYVHCNDCSAEVNGELYKDAIKAWDTRDESTLTNIFKELKEGIEMEYIPKSDLNENYDALIVNQVLNIVKTLITSIEDKYLKKGQ